MAGPLALLELIAPGQVDEDLVDLSEPLEGKGFTVRPAYQRELTRGQVDLDRTSFVAGRLPFFAESLRRLRIVMPAPLDYLDAPDELLGRRVWPSTLGAVRALEGPVFVKPRGVAKRFPGRVVSTPEDLYALSSRSAGTPVWCAEPVAFRSEHRAFVTKGEVVSVRQYDGQLTELGIAQAQAMADLVSDRLTAGCAVDLGVLEDGGVVLVEVNDGFSLGRYGLDPRAYLDLLLARWTQLTEGTRQS